MFMSAAATTPEPTPTPTGTDKPSRIASLLGLVRKLIDYGKELATTLRTRGVTDPTEALLRFGTRDIALILARITAGLHRAAELEGRLLRSAARPDPAPAPARTPSQRAPRDPRERTPPAPDLARIPTPDEIAAEVRRRPVGAVIADICYDLGIRPNHPLWRELQLAIILHDGSLISLFRKTQKLAAVAYHAAANPPPIAPTASPSLAMEPACTGPP